MNVSYQWTTQGRPFGGGKRRSGASVAAINAARKHAAALSRRCQQNKGKKINGVALQAAANPAQVPAQASRRRAMA